MPISSDQPQIPASAGGLAPLLLITHESVGEKMAGPGIRAWEMARAVGEHGGRVTLATPFPSQRVAANVEIRTFSWEEPAGLLALIEQAGVVMAAGWVIARINTILGRAIEQPVIVDAYYVPEIEQLMYRLVRGEPDFDAAPLFLQDLFVYLRQGDFFTCTLNSQVDFWMGALLAAGRINEANLRRQPSLENLLAVVPFGLPAHAPPAPVRCMKGIVPGIDPTDRVLYWGGGIWDWTDPDTYLDALAVVFRQRSGVRAVFGALHHFSPEIVPAMDAAGRLLERVRREGWLGSRVFFLDWVPYDRRSDFLQEADLGVSLVQRTLENRYAIRSRLLDHLWTGLPAVLTAGDEMAGVLASAGLARLIAPVDAQAAAEAILDWLDQPPSARAAAQAGMTDLRQRFAWPNAVLPVVTFLRSPRRAADAEQARSTIGEMTHLRREWDQLRSRASALQEEVRTLRSSRPVRAADALGNLLARLGIRL